MGRESGGALLDRTLGQNLGLTATIGPMWKKTRGWTFRNLRNFGFGKTSEMETSVNVEVSHFLRELQEMEDSATKSLILPVSKVFLHPMGSIMYKMIAGQHSGVSQDTLRQMNETTVTFEEAFTFSENLGACVAVYMPWVRFLFPGWTGRTALIKCRNVMQKESKVSRNHHDNKKVIMLEYNFVQ